MYFSAICLVFCAFYIHSACCGLITDKLKLSQDSQACPPGVWTCSTGKRSEIAKVDDISQTMQRRAVKSYPPEIWTRDELEETQQLTHKQMWAQKKKRMLKQMPQTALKTSLKTSKQDGGLEAKVNPSQVSNNACPPGVWTCSTGKRSEITNQDQVQVLDKSSSNIIVKEQNSLHFATRSCPPGMWVCDEVITNWSEYSLVILFISEHKFCRTTKWKELMQWPPSIRKRDALVSRRLFQDLNA